MKTNQLKFLAGTMLLTVGLFPIATFAKITVNGETDVEIGTHDDDTGTQYTLNSSASTSVKASVNQERNDDEHGDMEIEIDHEDGMAATTSIDKPEHVSNRGQLRSFLNHVIKNDDHIDSVVVGTSTVEAHYKLPARFLWTIPTNLTANVTVDASGNVTVTYPWYAFLFAKKHVEADLGSFSTTTANTNVTLSASAQAQLLNSLFVKLRAERV